MKGESFYSDYWQIYTFYVKTERKKCNILIGRAVISKILKYPRVSVHKEI